MMSSVRQKCGVADYTRDLARDLGSLADVRLAPCPDVTSDCRQALHQIHREADLLHIQYHPDFFGTWRTPSIVFAFDSFLRRVRVPIVLTIHDHFSPRIEARSHPSKIRGAIFNWFVLPLINRTAYGRFVRGGFLKHARHLIVHSGGMKIALQEFGVRPESVSVLYPGVPILPDSSGIAIREIWGIDKGKRIVTLFGFVRPLKGIEIALQALVGIPEAVLLIAGGAPDGAGEEYVTSLSSLSESLGIKERVKVTGYLAPQDAAAALVGSDAIVLPYPETLTSASYALSYAAAAGRPLVVSDSPFFKEIQLRYNAFTVFRAGDQEALASAVQDVLAEDRNKAGAEEFRKNESWSNTAARTFEIYRKILAADAAEPKTKESASTLR